MDHHRRKHLRGAERPADRRALAHARGGVLHGVAHRQIGHDLAGDAQCFQDWHGAGGERRERAREARGVVAADHLADRAARAAGRRGSGAAPPGRAASGRSQTNPRMSTTSSSRPQLRRKSEIAIRTCVRIGSSAFEFSNCLTILGTTNVSSMRDDRDADDEQQHRVQHRVQRAAAQLLAALGVVGEAFQHGVQVARLLAGRDRRAIQLGEHGREIRQAVGERVAFHHLGAHAHDDAADARASRSAPRPRAALHPAAGRSAPASRSGASAATDRRRRRRGAARICLRSRRFSVCAPR